MINALSKLTHALSNALLALAALGLIAMTGIIGWLVYGRFILNSSPSWAEQASLTLMIWYIAFGAAAAVREGFHIRIVVFENALPASAKRAVRMIADLIVAASGIAMVIWGSELVMRTWGHVIPSLGLPRGLAYLGLPVAGALIVLFALSRALEEATGRTVEDEEVY